eukprot:409041-Amphidinium_carterae.1
MGPLSRRLGGLIGRLTLHLGVLEWLYLFVDDFLAIVQLQQPEIAAGVLETNCGWQLCECCHSSSRSCKTPLGRQHGSGSDSCLPTSTHVLQAALSRGMGHHTTKRGGLVNWTDPPSAAGRALQKGHWLRVVGLKGVTWLSAVLVKDADGSRAHHDMELVATCVRHRVWPAMQSVTLIDELINGRMKT